MSQKGKPADRGSFVDRWSSVIKDMPTSKGQPSENLPALPDQQVSLDVVKLIAKDIGTEVRDYIERMYPEAVKASSSSFLLSVRNIIYNEIIAALGTTDEKEIRNRLADRKVARRRLKAMVKSGRERDWEAVRAASDVGEGSEE